MDITVSELIQQLSLSPSDAIVHFEGLSFQRVKTRGPKLVAIEFNDNHALGADGYTFTPLSRAERLIIANQYKLLAIADPENKAQYEEALRALESGYTYHYFENTQVSSDELNPEECDELLEILSMFQGLQESFELLDDKAGLTIDDVRFQGLDGNNESKQMGYIRWFCESDGGKFAPLGKDYLTNSHRHMLPRYRKMLGIWRTLQRRVKLSAKDIRSVLDA